MDTQRAVTFIKALPGIFQQLTVFHKAAILSAFLGSVSLGYGLYLQFYPVGASSPEKSLVQLGGSMSEEEIKVGTASAEADLETLAVDVSGAVINPGVYLLSTGQRVSDAVASAGGFAKKADRMYINKTINLAQTVQDAMKIYIPFEGEVIEEVSSGVVSSSTKESSATQSNTINVNSASISALDELQGIGVARAQQIVDNRPYANLAEFTEKSGLSQSMVDQLASSLSF